jgi:drug/metabolite transporter (DMT)-like permease
LGLDVCPGEECIAGRIARAFSRSAFFDSCIAAAGRLLGANQTTTHAWKGGVVTGLFLFLGYLLQTMGFAVYDTGEVRVPHGPVHCLGTFARGNPVSQGAQSFRMDRCPARYRRHGLMTLSSTRLQIGAGDLLTVGCAFAFAIHILMLGHYAKRVATEWLTLLQIGSSAVFATVACGFVETPFIRWTPGVILALGVTACLATALAFLVQTWGQRHTTPTRAALIFSLEPVFAWLTSYVFEHEYLRARCWAERDAF